MEGSVAANLALSRYRPRDTAPISPISGSNMVFRPPNPIKVDVSQFIGGTIDQVKLMLVDQHGL